MESETNEQRVPDEAVEAAETAVEAAAETAEAAEAVAEEAVEDAVEEAAEEAADAVEEAVEEPVEETAEASAEEAAEETAEAVEEAADAVKETEPAEAAAEEPAEEAAEKSVEPSDAEETPAPKKRLFDAPAIIAIICAVGILGAVVYGLLGGTGSYALKVNGTPYSAAEVNYEYMSVFQQYSQYSQYFGSVLPSDPYTMEQDSEYETWGDFYMAQTKEKLKQLTSLCDLAKEHDVKLSDEDIASIDDWIEQLKTSAVSMGKDDFDAFVSENFGEGVTEEVLRSMAERETLAMNYVQHFQDNLEVSDEELEAAYEADKDKYDTYSFQYCLVAAETDDDGAAGEEQLAAAKEKADAILAAAQKGDGDKLEQFKAAAGDNPETAVNAAAMDGDTLSQYQVPFEDWLKDADRAAGDMDVFEQDGYGWFVILFEGRERNNDPTVNVRHILIQAEDADENGEISDEELAAAKAEIERIKGEYDAGEQTEDAFAALANQYSTDPGSNTNGGLYENVYEGQMVPEFNDFCFDESRKEGDVEIIADEQYNGYHLMYFVGKGEAYTNQVIRDTVKSTAMEEFANSLTEGVTVNEGAEFEQVGLTEAFLKALQSDSAEPAD